MNDPFVYSPPNRESNAHMPLAFGEVMELNRSGKMSVMKAIGVGLFAVLVVFVGCCFVAAMHG